VVSIDSRWCSPGRPEWLIVFIEAILASERTAAQGPVSKMLWNSALELYLRGEVRLDGTLSILLSASMVPEVRQHR
jgi:hypothetical protein